MKQIDIFQLIGKYKLKFRNYCFYIVVVQLVFLCSCKKFVDVGTPKVKIGGDYVFTNDETATATVLGMFSKISETFSVASGTTSLYGGLLADELRDYTSGTDQQQFFQNSLSISNSAIEISWRDWYKYIYYSNAIIVRLNTSTSVSALLKSQLKGEALLTRSFCYFYLTNFWGDVPLITGTDYRINSLVSRTSKSQIYQQTISDLKEAESLLNDNYLNGSNSITTERVRPNKWAATALLARIYLYTNDWANAEQKATSIINNSSQYSLLANLNDVFKKNSMESIWQLLPVKSGFNTWEGNLFILTAAPNSVSLRNELINSIETLDNRKNIWVGTFTSGTQAYYFPYKYKVKTGASLSEYVTILRLAEQYLIRAEARAQQSNISGAQADLNTIRVRAGLLNTSANDKSSLLIAIGQERRIEFFAEWGQRWLDLKRTNQADVVLAPLKAPNWQSTDTLYPIPQSEILKNSNL